MRYDRVMTLVLIAIPLCSALAVPGETENPATRPATLTSYDLPTEWKGAQEGTQDGNPFVQDGRPLWRVDHVWPDDWQDPDNFKPLIWARGRWALPRKSEGEHHDRPDVRIVNKIASLGAFASRWGTPKDQQFTNKAPALVFIAPAAGTFVLNFQAESHLWTGDGPVRILILKHDQAAREMKMLANEEIKPAEIVKFAEMAVRLNETDELLLLPQIDKQNVGCVIDLSELSIVKNQ
ncbi:MAG: hypothetical protein M3O30_08190 [Planctomycetota bacterium]|nr:hypothetical protein [Planctomycetota bacterium]